MFFPIRRAAAAITFVLVPAAWAQQGLTLGEAQSLALARNQQLVASDAGAAAVREMAVAARQLPDPVLKAGIDNLPVNGPDRFSLTRDFMTMRRIGVMQELTRSDKRELKAQRLEADGVRIQAEREQVVANIQRDTALAWIERRYTQAMVALIDAQLREAQAQVEAAEVALRGGRGSQADVFAARTALANLQDKLRQTQRQSQAADVMLARWIGAEAGKRPLAGEIDWKNSALATSVSEHLKSHPAVAVLAAQLDAAQAELKLAHANTRPDITVEAAYQQRGPAYSNMLSVGVAIPLQIDRFNRQDREVAAKTAMLREAQARYDDALAAEEAMLRTLVNDWQSGKERLARLSEDLLPAARNRTESALAAYRSGKGDLSAVLGARRDEIDVSMQLLALEMDTARLWARLNFLIPSRGAGAPMNHS